MANFYHVFIRAKEGVTITDIENTMDLALEWFRLTSHESGGWSSSLISVWIIYTTLNEHSWYERLRPLVEPGGSLFICQLDTSHSTGLMYKKFWDWLEKTPKKR
jgi:hypothetical protein